MTPPTKTTTTTRTAATAATATTPTGRPVPAAATPGPRLSVVPVTTAAPADLDTAAREGDGEGLGEGLGDAGPQGRAKIRIGGNPDAIRTLKAAIASRTIPELYVVEGTPVRMERVSGTHAVDVEAVDDDVPLPVRPTAITTKLLAALLASHTYTYRLKARTGESGGKEFYEEEVTPPGDVLGAVLAGAEWHGVPPLAGIIGTPVLRRDWSLLQDPGYDEASGLYLTPLLTLPPVPTHPTPAQVATARAFVLDCLLRDFEWEDGACLANFIALMVTPFLRRPLNCLVPLAILSASMPGSGKTLLTAMIGLLVGQQTVPWPDGDDTELAKLITSTFTVESGAVIFDNLPEGSVISSPILANLLTNPVWSSRILGKSGMGAWPNNRLWMVTGNNLRVGGDIASRALYIGLKPRAPHPEERTGFAIGDLEEWLKNTNHRAELLWRLLVLVADWVNAGTPRDTTTPPMRQFTSWARGVGGFLTHHHIPGFLTNLSTMRGMDEEDRKWAIFLTGWQERFGGATIRVTDVMTSAEIVRDPITGRDVDPWDGEFITDKDLRRPRNAPMLGLLLKGHVDRFHGDPPLVLRRVNDGHNKTNLYRVEGHHP